MEHDDWIDELITEYLDAVHSLTQRLATTYGQTDLLEGRRNKAIPRVSETSSGLDFSFHGIGCWISDGRRSVDLDFLPSGQTDGFDAWRLHVFTEENPSFVGVRSQSSIEHALEQRMQAGLIQPVEGSRLYRRRAMLKGGAA